MFVWEWDATAYIQDISFVLFYWKGGKRIHQEFITVIHLRCAPVTDLGCVVLFWELAVKDAWLDVTLQWKAQVDPGNKPGCQWDRTVPGTLCFFPPCAQEAGLVHCRGSHARLWARGHPFSNALARSLLCTQAGVCNLILQTHKHTFANNTKTVQSGNWESVPITRFVDLVKPCCREWGVNSCACPCVDWRPCWGLKWQRALKL